MQIQHQQGDVLLIKLNALPLGEKRLLANKKCLLAHGESGHSHILEDDEAELIEIGNKMLLSLSKSATVYHEEHKPVTLTEGVWEIGRVREFNYLTKMVRPVVD